LTHLPLPPPSLRYRPAFACDEQISLCPSLPGNQEEIFLAVLVAAALEGVPEVDYSCPPLVADRLRELHALTAGRSVGDVKKLVRRLGGGGLDDVMDF